MEMKWEEFATGPARKGGMHVTLSRKGDICIGAAAFERWGKPDAAILMYDEEKKVIGLKPTHPRTANAFPMNALKWGRHRVVRANRFCTHYRIRVDRMMAFSEPKIEGNVLLLDLKEMISAAKKVKALEFSDETSVRGDG